MPTKPTTHTTTGHQRAAKASERLHAMSVLRLYDSAWATASRQFLQANPLCAECAAQKIRTAASVTDHVVPYRGSRTMFWDVANWQPLCKPCHDAKTGRETAQRAGHRVRTQARNRLRSG